MCPLTRLVHSLNDCFDDRTHWYTLSLSYHQIFLTEQKNSTKNWQQQSNDQISKVFFHFKEAEKSPSAFIPSHSTHCRHILTHSLLREKRRKTKNFQVIIQCNAIFIAVTTRFKRVLKPFLLLLFVVSIHQRVFGFWQCDKLNARRMLCCVYLRLCDCICALWFGFVVSVVFCSVHSCSPTG